MNSITDLRPTQLRKAADVQEKILALQEELGQLLGGSSAAVAEAAAEGEAPRKKRKFGAASRAKMRKAQKARWARIKAAQDA